MAVTTKVDVRDIPIDKIRRNEAQPRRLFDQEALEELASSIRQHGVLQPVVVRDLGEGTFGLIAGERRWRAAQLAQTDTLPARVLDDVDDLRAFELGVLENVNREDMTVIEEASAYQELVNAGRDLGEVAGLFGKTTSYVKWRIDLLALTDELQQLVAQGSVKTNLAWYVAKLSPSSQRRVANKYAKGEFKTESEAQAYAEALALQEAQGELLSDGLSEEERAERRETRKQAKSATAKIDGLVDGLDRFAKMTPAKMFEALEGELGKFYDRLDALARTLNATKRTARKAKAIADAHAENGGSERAAQDDDE